MKNYLFITLSIIILNTSLVAQWDFQNSGVSTNLYTSYFLNPETGWLAGANGVILKTTNGGSSWLLKPSGTSNAISFIKFFNPNNGISAGAFGTIKKSSDGGESWFSITSGTSLTIQEGSFLNENLGWLVGNNGLVLKTTDGGDTWAQSFTGPFSNYWVQFISEDVGWICGANGEIKKTTNGGSTWELKAQVGGFSLWGVYFVTPSVGWVVGEFGAVFRSIDGGETWNPQQTGTVVSLRSIYFHDIKNGWVVGKDEKMLRTTNGGDSWIIEHTGNDYEYLQIYFYDENIGWILGTPGFWTGNPSVILYTDNNGGYPIQTSPISILAPNGGEILTAGSTYFIEWNSQNVVDVKIEYSTDNGTNWLSVIDSIPSTGIYDWMVPNTLTTEGRVKISDLTDSNIFDISDQSFTIQSSKVITVISPNGGEILDGGSQYEILWSSEDVEYVKLEHSINNGASWNSIAGSTESTGVFFVDGAKYFNDASKN